MLDLGQLIEANTFFQLLVAATPAPVSLVYGQLAVVYGFAAALAREEGHRLLARCYWASAVAHAALVVCHQLHL